MDPRTATTSRCGGSSPARWAFTASPYPRNAAAPARGCPNWPSSSKRWAPRCCARRFSPPSRWPTQAILTSGDRDAMVEVPARIRRRFDHRDADPQRTSWTMEPRRGDVDRTFATARAYRVIGDAPMVLDGHTADVVLLAAASTDAGISVAIAAESTAGVAPRDRSPAWTAPARSRRLRFDGAPATGSSEPTATRPLGWRAHRISRSWRWRANRSERRNAASTWRSTTPRTASSSAGRSAASRRSSIGARTCWCRSRGRAQPSCTPPKRGRRR